MARRDGATDSELVDEIDGIFDRGAHWVGSHPQLVVIAIGVLLAVAAAIGFARERRSASIAAAEAATAGVYDAYLVAMGGQPGVAEAPVPANPQLARSTRAEFATKLLEAASAHRGTAAAVNARLLAAKLLDENGDASASEAARKLAAEEAPSDSPIAALAWSRWAVALESKGDLEGAAQAFERAAEVESPGRALALADAARCYAQLGDTKRALELFGRAEGLDLDALPMHVRQRLLELQAAEAAK